jgi:outer membrane protein
MAVYLEAMPIPDLLPPERRPKSLPELLDIALSNNPETRTAWWNAQRAAASRAFVATDYSPKIRFHGDVIQSRDYKFPNGDETTFTCIDADIILGYLLYDFGERNAKNAAAKAALLGVQWQSNWTIQKVMHNVISQTYIYLNAREILQSRIASLHDAQTALKASQELQAAGLRSITDVYTMKAAIADMEIAIALQKAETAISQGKLAANMGLEVDADVRVMELPDPNKDEIENDSLYCLIEEANLKRADLMAKRSELQQKYALMDKAAAQYKPKINFNAAGGYKRYLHDKRSHDHGGYYRLVLNFDMPLYDGFEAIYQNRIALSDAQATGAELERLELEIAMEILSYSKLFEAAKEILSLAQESLQNSMKTFDGTLEKYKAGTQSIFDLIAAQKQLAEARIKHGEAKTRWYRSLAQLAYATGTISQFTEDPCVTTY